jgi:hypothetical protein
MERAQVFFYSDPQFRNTAQTPYAELEFTSPLVDFKHINDRAELIVRWSLSR